ncbi:MULTISPECIES: four-helix bundle copper-binding protein [Chitinophagaceae]
MESVKITECLDACLACMAACNLCASSCLNESDADKMMHCIAIDNQCAVVCACTANLLAMQSPYVSGIVALCSIVCDACALECGKHTHAHCRVCADACVRCSELCRELALA